MPRFNINDSCFCVYYGGPVKIKSSELIVMDKRGYVAEVIGIGLTFIKAAHLVTEEHNFYVSSDEIILKGGDIIGVQAVTETFKVTGQPKKESGAWVIEAKGLVSERTYTWRLIDLCEPAPARAYLFKIGQDVLLKRGNECHRDVQLLRGTVRSQRADGRYNVMFENGRDQIVAENKLVDLNKVDEYLAGPKEAAVPPEPLLPSLSTVTLYQFSASEAFDPWLEVTNES